MRRLLACLLIATSIGPAYAGPPPSPLSVDDFVRWWFDTTTAAVESVPGVLPATTTSSDFTWVSPVAVDIDGDGAGDLVTSHEHLVRTSDTTSGQVAVRTTYQALRGRDGLPLQTLTVDRTTRACAYCPYSGVLIGYAAAPLRVGRAGTYGFMTFDYSVGCTGTPDTGRCELSISIAAYDGAGTRLFRHDASGSVVSGPGGFRAERIPVYRGVVDAAPGSATDVLLATFSGVPTAAVPNALDYTLAILDGADGAVRTVGIVTGLPPTTFVWPAPDLDGDSYDDVLVTSAVTAPASSPDYTRWDVTARSSTTAREIWRVAALDANLPVLPHRSDFDGDGTRDIQLRLYYAIGPGNTVTSPDVVVLDGRTGRVAGRFPRSGIVVDVGADGRSEIVSVNSNRDGDADVVRVTAARVDGTELYDVTHRLPAAAARRSARVAGDTDGDGVLDVAFGDVVMAGADGSVVGTGFGQPLLAAVDAHGDDTAVASADGWRIADGRTGETWWTGRGNGYVAAARLDADTCADVFVFGVTDSGGGAVGVFDGPTGHVLWQRSWGGAPVPQVTKPGRRPCAALAAIP